MKIITIFAKRLFAFQFEKERKNELSRLLDDWNDVGKLYQFILENKYDAPMGFSIQELVEQLIRNANEIDENLFAISNDPNRDLGEFFKPLHNSEFRVLDLSKQKGRRSFLRIYALRIDENCYVITGGAIKFHHLNKDRKHTKIEMEKLNLCRDYLKFHVVFDDASFYEFINEN